MAKAQQSHVKKVNVTKPQISPLGGFAATVECMEMMGKDVEECSLATHHVPENRECQIKPSRLSK